MKKDKKKKSIYDYELKDVNKDGKKNFKDTWLGDALGFDGKLGTQGPGLKASMRGARRSMGGDKKEEAKSKGSSKKTPARPKSRPKSGSAGASGTGPGPSQGGAGGPKEKSKDLQRGPSKRLGPRGGKEKSPSAQTTSPTQSKAPKEGKAPKVSYEQWKKMTRKERRDAGLPETTLGWQNQNFGKNLFPGKSSSKSTTSGSSSRKTSGTRGAKNAGEVGMARGGMAKEGRYQQNGGRDMKKSGMFYKSGSPKGYK